MKSTGAKIISLVLALVMTFGFSAIAFADVNDINYSVVDGKYGVIISYSGTADADGVLEIEGVDTFVNMQLKEIADNAFKYVKGKTDYLYDVKTLILDKGIEVIGDSAFANLPCLEKVIFKDNVTVGDYAFANCFALKEIVFEGDASVKQFAFKDCSALDSIQITAAATFGAAKGALETTAWYQNYPIDFLTLGTNLVAYKGADKEVKIPLNITKIGASAFEGNTTLEKVILSMNVNTLGDKAFKDCTALKDVVFSDYGEITEVGTNVFENTPYYDDFEGDFFSIGSLLIKYKGHDEYVAIPNTIKEIAPACFDGCYESKTPDGYTFVISAIMVPASVTEFGENCFALAELDDGTFYVPMLYAYSNTPAMKALADAGYLTTKMPNPADVNDDGVVNSADARLALRIAVKLDLVDPIVYRAANISGDDKVSSEDARLILRIAVGLEGYTAEDLLYMPATDFEILQAYNASLKAIAKYNAGYTKTIANEIKSYDMSSQGRLYLLKDLQNRGVKNSTVTYEADTQAALDNIDFCSLITTDNIKNATCTLADNKYTITIRFKDVLDNDGTSYIHRVMPLTTCKFYTDEFAKNSWWEVDTEKDYNGNNIRKFDLTYKDPTVKVVFDKDSLKVESLVLSSAYRFAIDGKIRTIEISSKGYKTGDATLDRLDTITYSNFIY